MDDCTDTVVLKDLFCLLEKVLKEVRDGVTYSVLDSFPECKECTWKRNE